ncbi:MAG: ATP-binding protein [Phycisphaerales bacterium]|nr:ATP-binding protein [Phycisphaerales bacterium]
MLKKIVIIGPESTGKSTLSKALAEQLNTVWVPEYARTYLEQKNQAYQFEDLSSIAKGQIELEDVVARKAHQYLICDTDLYVVKVWSEHKYGKVAPFILERIAQRQYDAYILCDIDMPWDEDPLREHPEPEMRQYFYNIYKDIVLHSGKPFSIVSGSEEERLAQALAAPWFKQG